MNEDVSVSELLNEANDLYSAVTQTNEQNEAIGDTLDLIEEVGKSEGGLKQESYSPENVRILSRVFKSVVGYTPCEHYGIKLEDGMNPTQTKLVFENIKQIVKEFWLALKNSFNSLWAKLKTWYIKIVSASESLVVKANKIKTRAERLSSTPETKKFDFKDHAYIQIDNKIQSIQLRTGLKTTKTILDQTLNVRTTNEVENMVTSAEESLDNFIKNSSTGKPDSSWVSRFDDLYVPKVNVNLEALTDKDVKEQIIYDEANADYKVTQTLPGNTVIVYSSLKATSTLEMSEKLNLISARMAKTRQSDKVHAEAISVDVLNAAEISDICDNVVDLNEQITFYEKAWQRRDKFMNKVLSSLDKSVDKIDNEDTDDHNAKVYKKTTRSILSAIKRSNTFNSVLINYVVKISAGSLAYCEASLAMYKA